MEEFLYNPNVISLIIVWELVWKAFALWSSAQKDRKYWFIALLVLNTAGLLPIIYLVLDKYYLGKKQTKETKKKK